MPEDALKFLEANRVGVLAIEMPDGAPHGATVHFAHLKDPLTFIIYTGRTSRKAEPLLDGGTTRASFVIGTDEDQMRTLQMDGIVSRTDADEYQKAYFTKFPPKEEQHGNKDIFVIFTPTWWRYSDYKASGGKKITDSSSVKET